MDPTTIFMLIALVAIMYFMLIRPAQKKAKEQQELVTTLQPGTRIMTTAGVFGTIRHLGDVQAIIEISPGIEMTVTKQAILRAVREEEDEFEYEDADADPDAAASDDAPAQLVEHPDVRVDDDHEVAAEDAPAHDDLRDQR